MLDFPDMPALPALASLCASAQNRFPPPPEWLLDDPVTVSSSRDIEDLVSFIHTGIALASRSAFDGNPVLSTTGEALSCDDIVEALIYWTRVAVHGLERSEQDEVGDVGDLTDELNTVIGILVPTVGTVRDRGMVESDQDATWTTLDSLRRQIEL